MENTPLGGAKTDVIWFRSRTAVKGDNSFKELEFMFD